MAGLKKCKALQKVANSTCSKIQKKGQRTGVQTFTTVKALKCISNMPLCRQFFPFV